MSMFSLFDDAPLPPDDAPPPACVYGVKFTVTRSDSGADLTAHGDGVALHVDLTPSELASVGSFLGAVAVGAGDGLVSLLALFGVDGDTVRARLAGLGLGGVSSEDDAPLPFDTRDPMTSGIALAYAAVRAGLMPTFHACAPYFGGLSIAEAIAVRAAWVDTGAPAVSGEVARQLVQAGNALSLAYDLGIVSADQLTAAAVPVPSAAPSPADG